MTKIVVRGRGRPKTFATKINVVDALNSLATVSYPLMRQLRAAGYVEAVKDFENKGLGRGRAPFRYEVTGKGRNLINLSRKWKRD